MQNQNNKALAKLLRDLADQVEKGDTLALDSLGPTLGAVLYDRRQLQRPNKIPTAPQKPEAPTIFYDNGVPHPMGIRRRVELADTKTHSYVSWPHNWQQLAKFAKLPEVKRDFWTGSKKIYGDALRLFAKYGMIVRKGNGYEWSREYTPLARKEFAKQFAPLPMASHA